MEVVALFNHTPYYASQVALLDSSGRYQSSFWNPGNTMAGVFFDGRPAADFADIDDDGYDEILIVGTNNAFQRAVFIVLDPRSVRGKGPVPHDSSMTPTWQHYVLFPYIEELQNALGTPRLQGKAVYTRTWLGQATIRVDIFIHVSGRGQVGAFAYSLDYDLNVIDFHQSDEFVLWAQQARDEGKLEFDVRSREFRNRMCQIEVRNGPEEWLLP
jgi:hypothetical protein